MTKYNPSHLFGRVKSQAAKSQVRAERTSTVKVQPKAQAKTRKENDHGWAIAIAKANGTKVGV